MYNTLPILATLTGVNINSATTDYAITLPNGSQRIVPVIIITDASANASGTWTYGVFTGTGGTGTALLGNGANARAGLTDANGCAVSFGTGTTTGSTIYFRVGTALGSAGTVTVHIAGFPAPTATNS